MCVEETVCYECGGNLVESELRTAYILVEDRVLDSQHIIRVVQHNTCQDCWNGFETFTVYGDDLNIISFSWGELEDEENEDEDEDSYYWEIIEDSDDWHGFEWVNLAEQYGLSTV